MSQDSKRRVLHKDPVAYPIFKQCLASKMSDKEIAHKLEKECGYVWCEATVRRLRLKQQRPKLDPIAEQAQSPTLTTPPPGMPDAEKANWFRNQFRLSHLYKILCDQFERSEVVGYLEEFGHMCTQFEDLVTTEFYAIDDFLKHRILINQQLAEMKRIRRAIEEAGSWLRNNPNKPDASKEETRDRIERMRMLDNLHSGLKQTSERYDSYVKERAKIYESLAARRTDRLAELRGGQTTFFDVVAQIQSSEAARIQNGRYAELTRIAAREMTSEFRKPTTFPDGSRSPVVLDDQTDFSEEEEDGHDGTGGEGVGGSDDAATGGVPSDDGGGPEDSECDTADPT